MTIEDLIDTVTTWPVGMPVRAMEQLIAEGTAAVPALHQSLERWQDDDTRDIIWIVVLLGEMRHADSIDRLIRQLRETDFDYLAAAALADRYGDPDGLLQPVKTPIRAGKKVGRNEPSPCGSGQKYKYCCSGKIL